MEDLIPREKGTVYILGAGASYGTSLKEKPPTIKNFFKETNLKKLKYDYSPLWKLLNSLGINIVELQKGVPDIEEIYSKFDIISSGLWYLNENEYRKDVGNDFWKVTPVDLLKSFIVEIINPVCIYAKKNNCKYHNKIVESLVKGDTIISFNYDLIIDISLSKIKRWSEFNGYGFFDWEVPEEINKDIDEIESDILLLKPHGSINWDKKYTFNYSKENSLNLKTFRENILGKTEETRYKIKVNLISRIKEKAYSPYLASDKMEFYNHLASNTKRGEAWKIAGIERNHEDIFIIPPTLFKFGNEVFPEQIYDIWAKMRLALMKANEIILIGYSFSNTDIQFSTLFKMAILNNKNNLKIKIVNPDNEVEIKLKNMFPSLKVNKVADTLEKYCKEMN